MHIMKALFMFCSITLTSPQQAFQQNLYHKTAPKKITSHSLRHVGTYCLATLVWLTCLEPASAQNNSSILHETFINNGFFPLAGQLLLLSTLTANAARSWMGLKIEPQFCTAPDHALNAPHYIDDPEVIAEDDEGLIPFIQQYAPVLYLHQKESYFPLSATEWCTGVYTEIRSPDDSAHIPAGQVSMEIMDDLFREQLALQEQNRSFYITNPDCSLYGSDPAHNKDAEENLITPCYVITSEDAHAIYIQYMFLYGFNQPYDLGPFTGDIIAKQNAHEADLEHITLELDRETKKMRRIFYAAHSSREGVWLPANHSDIHYEGTHPVAFVARGAHGVYPKEGTYVRIYGVANDITQKGLRWTPRIIRLYEYYDHRFDPATMGWSVFPGDLGKRGVAAPALQGWYAQSVQGDLGKSYDELFFCENPTMHELLAETNFIAYITHPALSIARYLMCIASHAPLATPPTIKIQEIP